MSRCASTRCTAHPSIRTVRCTRRRPTNPKSIEAARDRGPGWQGARRGAAVSGTRPIVTLFPRDYDAVLFDLDGVLTRTATVHAAAWKRLFDDFLREHAAGSGT